MMDIIHSKVVTIAAVAMVLVVSLGAISAIRDLSIDDECRAVCQQIAGNIDSTVSTDGQVSTMYVFSDAMEGVNIFPETIAGEHYSLTIMGTSISLTRDGKTYGAPLIGKIHLWDPGTNFDGTNSVLERIDEHISELVIYSNGAVFFLGNVPLSSKGSYATFISLPDLGTDHTKLHDLVDEISSIWSMNNTSLDNINMTIKKTPPFDLLVGPGFIIGLTDPMVCAGTNKAHLWKPADDLFYTTEVHLDQMDGSTIELNVSKEDTLTITRRSIYIQDNDQLSVHWFMYIDE